jgi:hypothetical protein
MFRTLYFDFRIKHFHEQIMGVPMASGKPFRRLRSLNGVFWTDISDIISVMKSPSAVTACYSRPGRPASYRQAYCDRVVELMAKGRSLDGCAALLGVHPDSLYEWRKVHPEFSVAVRAGRAAATALWETRLLDVAQGGSDNAQAIQWAPRNRSRAASGWDHAHAKLEVSGPDGGAVQLQTEVTVIDARLLTPEQRNVFKQVLLAARAQGELVA